MSGLRMKKGKAKVIKEKRARVARLSQGNKGESSSWEASLRKKGARYRNKGE